MIALREVTLDEAEQYYSPSRIDAILKAWPAYESRAQGYRSTLPDALRPSKGPVVSGNVTAAICADILQALVACCDVGGVEWRVVQYRRQGWTFGQMGYELHMTKQSAHERYWLAVGRMAVCLGWVPEDEGVE